MKMLEACSCGCRNFKIDEMTVTLKNVPLRVNQDGSYTYSDARAESSSGWNRVVDSRLTCRKCGRTVSVAQGPGPACAERGRR